MSGVSLKYALRFSRIEFVFGLRAIASPGLNVCVVAEVQIREVTRDTILPRRGDLFGSKQAVQLFVQSHDAATVCRRIGRVGVVTLVTHRQPLTVRYVVFPLHYTA